MTALPDTEAADATLHNPYPGVRLGVIAVDPLRIIGLSAILEETLVCSIKHVALEEVGRDEVALSALVIDAAADDAASWPLVTAVSTLHPTLPVLVLGEVLSAEQTRQVHAAGARGYLSNRAHEAEIRACVTAVLRGEAWPPRAALPERGSPNPMVLGTGAPLQTPLRERLTPRECEVMDLLLDGRSNREIALSMQIDEATVKAHLGRMLRKANCSNRVELTLRAAAERPAKPLPPRPELQL